MNNKIIPHWLSFHCYVSVFVGLYGSLLLLLGLGGSFSKRNVLFLSLVFLVIFVCVIKRSLSKIIIRNPFENYIDTLICLGILFFVTLTTLQGLVPPIDRDALIQHLALPQLYLQNGLIFDLPFAEHAYNPLVGDMFYVLPLIFRLDIITSFIHYSFGLLSAHLLYCFVKFLYGRRWGLLSVLIFLSIPQVVQSGSQAYVDLTVTYFSLLGWCLIFFIAQQENLKNQTILVILSGACFGFSMGSKYNGFLLFAFSILVLFFILRSKGLRKHLILKYLFVFVVFGVFCDFSSLLKNFLWTGNPIWPYLSGILGTKIVSDEAVSSVPALLHRYWIYRESVWHIALLPIRIFFTGIEGNPIHFDGKLTPLLIIFIPLLFFQTHKKEKKLIFAICFIVFGYFFYVLVLRILRMRYLMPIIPFFVLLTIMAMKTLTFRFHQWVIALIVWVFLLLNVHWAVERFQQREVIGFLSGSIDRPTYISRRYREFPVQQMANEHLQATSKILFVFLGHRGYYSKIPYTYDFHDPGRRWRRWQKDLRDEDQLKNKILAEGISHLMVDQKFFNMGIDENFLLSPFMKKIIRKFLERHTKIMYEYSGIQLIEII